MPPTPDPLPDAPRSEEPGKSKRLRQAATLGLALAGFLAAYLSPIEYTFSDPWGNLPTAQAILENGTIKLDDYAESHAIAGLGLASRHRGHLYSFFPLGTPILALPAVLAANAMGLDMSSSADNTALPLLLPPTMSWPSTVAPA